MIDFKQLKRGIIIASKGIIVAIEQEQTFCIQFFAGAIAAILAIWLPLTMCERGLIFLAIAGVLGMELINTQIEKVLNIIKPEIHPQVKAIKDLSAAAVLIMVIGSIVVGTIIFLPKIIALFS